MKFRKLIFTAVSVLALTTLAGCLRPPMPPTSETPTTSSGGGGPTEKIEVKFWTGFGASVTGALNPLFARFEQENPDIKVLYESKGGYPNLQQAINGSISTNTYPHIANGYPDHLVGYINANILVNLGNPTNYINHPDYGVDINEYNSDYMAEINGLSDAATFGLPFNKSTEVMIANQSFFDAAKAKDPSIFIPKTWQDLAVVGPKLKAVAKDNGWFGKLVLKDGTAVAKPAEFDAALKEQVAVDMTLVNENQFIPFSWDSASNFFITIIRQWGAMYTEKGNTIQNGYIRFQEEPHRTKTLAALSYFKELYNAGLIGLPDNFGEPLYSSTPFKEGKLVLTISSSAGVGENLPGGTTEYPFELSINPIPYNGDLAAQKSVIAQGTNLALFTVGQGRDPKAQAERLAAWRLLRFLTYEANYEFGKATSYFPVLDASKIDRDSQRYQDYLMYSEFLDQTDGTPREKVIRSTAKLQANVYMDPEAGWNKFVDPGFLGSSEIRNTIESVMAELFKGKTPEQVLNDTVTKLARYVQK